MGSTYSTLLFHQDWHLIVFKTMSVYFMEQFLNSSLTLN